MRTVVPDTDANSSNRFRWAACQLDTLEHCLDYDELKSALGSLPKDLYETYSRILTNIPVERQGKAIRLLQFLVYSERPIRLDEAVDAIATPIDGRRPFDPRYRLQCPQEIARFCPSLVSLVGKSYSTPHETVTELQLAHFSVKEYLTSGNLPELFQRHLSEPEARSSITRCCLAYISSLPPSLLTAPVRLPPYRTPRSKLTIDAKVREAFPLGNYWAVTWLNHAKSAETVDGMAATIADFFQNQIAFGIWCRLLFSLDPWEDYIDSHPNEVSPLYMASLNGLNVTVQTLLQRGAEVNASSGFHGNALLAASYRGHSEVVQVLLETGAEVDSESLEYARSNGHTEIFQMLARAATGGDAQEGGLEGDDPIDWVEWTDAGRGVRNVL